MSEDTHYFEPRLNKLEETTSELLNICKKIQERMVGGINSESPGMIDDIRNLKASQLETNRQIQEINKKIENLGSIEHAVDEISELKDTLNSLSKFRWITWGVLVGFGWLIANIGGLMEGLSKFFSIKQ